MKMRKQSTVSFLTVSILLGSWLVAGAENLLKNPGFESIRDGIPEHWETHAWAGEASFSVEREGRTANAVKIRSEDGADAAWTQTLEVPPFARLRLSGWIKTRNLQVIDGRGALFNVHDVAGAATETVAGTQDWTKVEREFEVMGRNTVQVNALLGGFGSATGTAWFDDVTLEVVEETRPAGQTVATTISIDPRPAPDPISKYIYGQFIEHMGRCIYGGIWAEMLEDRKFYYKAPATGDIWDRTPQGARFLAGSPWQAIGSPENIEMSTETPLSGDHSPRITLDGQPGGLYQEALGVLAGNGYTGRIVLRGEREAGPVEVSLVWGDGEEDRETVVVGMPTPDYANQKFDFTAGADSDNARLEIVGKGEGSFTIGAVSLMPDDNIKGFRRDTIELMKKLDSPVYRWPGGNFVSAYDWRDGLGDRDRRPTRSNPAWTGIETNDMGMHEFIQLCRLLDTEPMITVNTGFGDAYSAAAQVEYANGAPETSMGKRRTENGSREPFDVMWWCVGNEMWGEWQLGQMRLEHYILKHNWVEGMMREVDSGIVTVGSGDIGNDWSKGLLRGSMDYMDLIAEHFYTQHRSDLTEHVRQVPNAIRRRAEVHRGYREEIPGLADRDIRIAITEWNYWYGPHLFGELGTRYFMRDALGIAAGLHEYFRNTDIIHSAYYAQTVNVIGAIKTTDTAAEFDATALPLLLYRREFGTQPLRVEGWSEELDVAAAKTEDGRYLTLGFVNAGWNTHEVSLDPNGLRTHGKAAGWVISHENPMAHNHPGEEKVIRIVDLPETDIAETVTIDPVSITVFRVPLQSEE